VCAVRFLFFNTVSFLLGRSNTIREELLPYKKGHEILDEVQRVYEEEKKKPFYEKAGRI